MSNSNNEEIEKKFNVISDKWFYPEINKEEIFQAYFLDETDGQEKRIRIIPEKSRAIVTQKKDLDVIDGVLRREEIEYDIDFKKGVKILLSADVFLNKVRHFYPFHDFVFEIDVYKNLNFPLTTAEVELKIEQIPEFNALKLPSWVGEDWSLNKEFSNYNLTKKVNKEILLSPYFKALVNPSLKP